MTDYNSATCRRIIITAGSQIAQLRALGIRPKPDRSIDEFDTLHEIRIKSEGEKPKEHKRQYNYTGCWTQTDSDNLINAIKDTTGLIDTIKVGEQIGRSDNSVRRWMKKLGYADRLCKRGGGRIGRKYKQRYAESKAG